MRPPASEPPIPRSLPARRAAFAVAAAWAAVAIATCAAKFTNFLYTDFDLAIFSQGLFGAMHGRWFSSVRGMNWLGDHSSVSLLLLAPLAALWRSPLLLPCAQALALAAGALPLFAYARRKLGDEPAAAAFAAAWVLHPALGYLATFEFHPETFATTALLGVVAALAARRTRLALACAAVAALAKEDAALPLAVLGALTALRGRGPARRAGLGLVAVAAGSLVLSFAVLKPLLAHGEADYGAMYGAWGRTPARIALALLRHPFEALAAFGSTPGDALDSASKAEFWQHLMGPFSHLSWAAPLALLPALPVFAEHMLSFRPEQHTIVFQYTALTLPFVAVAAVDALAWITRLLGPRRAATHARRIAFWVVLVAAVFQWRVGPWTYREDRMTHPPTERTWPTGRDASLARWRAAFQRALPAHGDLVVDFPSLAPMSLRDSLHSLHHVAAGHFTFSSRPYPSPAAPAGLLADLSALSAMGEIGAGDLARLRDYALAHGLRAVDAAGDLVRLAPTDRDTLAWLVPVAHVPGAPLADFDGVLDCLGARLGSATARPGDRLAVATTWRRSSALAALPEVQWAVTGADGRLAEDEPRLLGAGWTDVAAWPAGAAFEERTTWVVPADLAPGEYTLSFSVAWRRGDLEREAQSRGALAEPGRIPVGRFRVLAR